VPHDVFISYSSKDKAIADAVCARLEARGIRCWIAPRDVQPGLAYGEAIIDGIRQCRIMVLLLSSSANTSGHIPKEVERAVSHGATVIPLRIEEVTPAKALDYFIGSVHWLDALTPPLERHLDNLADTILKLLPGLQESRDVVPRTAPLGGVTPAPAPPVTASRNEGARKWLLPAISGAAAAVIGVAIVAAVFWSRNGSIQGGNESSGSRPNFGVSSPSPANSAGANSTSERNAGSRSDPLIGCWQWFNDALVVISSNGTMTAGPFTARWRLADSRKRVYTFTWPEPVDTTLLSADGRTLSGANQYGFRMSATRLTSGPQIAGTWRWFNGVVVVIHGDGTLAAGNLTGRWRGSGLAYSLTWPSPVDTVTLSADHTRVDGANQYGVHVSGRKTASCGATEAFR
jgi:hypothetical protein